MGVVKCIKTLKYKWEMKMRSRQFKTIFEKEQDQRQGLLYLKQRKDTPTGQLRGIILWRKTNAENLVIILCSHWWVRCLFQDLLPPCCSDSVGELRTDVSIPWGRKQNTLSNTIGNAHLKAFVLSSVPLCSGALRQTFLILSTNTLFYNTSNAVKLLLSSLSSTAAPG